MRCKFSEEIKLKLEKKHQCIWTLARCAAQCDPAAKLTSALRDPRSVYSWRTETSYFILHPGSSSSKLQHGRFRTWPSKLEGICYCLFSHERSGCFTGHDEELFCTQERRRKGRRRTIRDVLSTCQSRDSLVELVLSLLEEYTQMLNVLCCMFLKFTLLKHKNIFLDGRPNICIHVWSVWSS